MLRYWTKNATQEENGTCKKVIKFGLLKIWYFNDKYWLRQCKLEERKLLSSVFYWNSIRSRIAFNVKSGSPLRNITKRFMSFPFRRAAEALSENFPLKFFYVPFKMLFTKSSENSLAHDDDDRRRLKLPILKTKSDVKTFAAKTVQKVKNGTKDFFLPSKASVRVALEKRKGKSLSRFPEKKTL